MRARMVHAAARQRMSCVPRSSRQRVARRLTQICFDRLGFIPGYIVLIIAGGGVVAYNGAPPRRRPRHLSVGSAGLRSLASVCAAATKRNGVGTENRICESTRAVPAGMHRRPSAAGAARQCAILTRLPGSLAGPVSSLPATYLHGPARAPAYGIVNSVTACGGARRTRSSFPQP